MEFSKELLFLGMQGNTLQDGEVFYKLSFYDPEGNAPVCVNVMAKKEDIIRELQSLKFGALVLCCFRLQEREKLYRLALLSAAPMQG